nr:ras-associated and pleckstrin homology domains-containing protein 1 isoform X2 [Aegilops tauschii subsp. strangulata]
MFGPMEFQLRAPKRKPVLPLSRILARRLIKSPGEKKSQISTHPSHLPSPSCAPDPSPPPPPSCAPNPSPPPGCTLNPSPAALPPPLSRLPPPPYLLGRRPRNDRLRNVAVNLLLPPREGLLQRHRHCRHSTAVASFFEYHPVPSSSCVASTMNIINATERLKMRLRLSLGVKKLYNILPNEVGQKSRSVIHVRCKSLCSNQGFRKH